MVTCAKCGTGWTSSGLPLCPVCGTKVETPAAPPERDPVIEIPAACPRKNGSAVLEVPLELRMPPVQLVEPTPSIPDVKEAAPMMHETPVESRKTDSRILQRLQISDPSAILPVVKDLPAPTRPLNGPLVLGILAYVGVILLPMAVFFESHRVLGVLGFCMAGFFAPFAPIAWMVGLNAEKRRRDQGLRAESRVSLGRLLGQWGTLLLVSEATIALVGIAALRLAGKFPVSFWAGIY
jgi:hypothetical protein